MWQLYKYMCTKPKFAVYSNDLTRDSRKPITFIPYADVQRFKERGVDVLTIPCGKCTDCRLKHAKEWSIRCMLEAGLHNENHFLTLTYDDGHLPSAVPVVDPLTGEFIRAVNPLVKRDFQLFMKKLRINMERKYGHTKIRFFGCGEYGSQSLRPHYHIILFNCPLYDLKFYKKNGSHNLYNSAFLDDCWDHKGYITVSDCCVESCAYTAGYVMKKAGDRGIQGVPSEFILMSRRPGIGSKYFVDNMERIYVSDTIYSDGRTFPVPRFCDKLADVSLPSVLQETKEKRRKIGKLIDSERSPFIFDASVQREISQAYIKNSFINHEITLDKNTELLYNSSVGGEDDVR